MIYIPILLIIIILSLDLYFTFSIRFKNEKFENEKTINEDDNNETIFDEPNPWNKIKYKEHVNKYYIKINNLNKYIEKIMLWKTLPSIKSDLIDMDIENNYLIFKTQSEEEALVVCNLIINHINNNLTINDIVSKNLINYSINKAKRHKLISIKLTELIKEGLIELDSNVEKLLLDDDDNNDKRKETIEKIKSNNIESNNIKEIKTSLFDNIEPYEGSEYASINF